MEFEVLERLETIESLDDLFEIWKQKGGVRETFEVFCEDGIIDKRLFHKRRILFVLKDLHLEDKGEYLQLGKIDMRRHVCDKEDWRTWNPIALWAKALLDDNIKKFDDIKSEIVNKQELRNEYLGKVAFMNLKKEAGRAHVPNECILHYAEVDAPFLFKQISILKPDIIIACGAVVFEALKSYVFCKCETDNSMPKINLCKKMANYGDALKVFAWGEEEKPLVLVKYRHPVDYGRGSCTAEEHYNNMLEIRKRVFGQ